MRLGPDYDLGFVDPAEPLDRGSPYAYRMTGWWLPLKDAPGGKSLRDLSGNNNHGTYVGGSGWFPGYLGTPAILNGASAYVSCGSGSANDISGDLTVAFWGYLNASSASWYGAVAKRASAGTGDAPVSFNVGKFGNDGAGNQDKFFYSHYDTGWRDHISSYVIPALEWHHYIVSRIGSTVYFYVDGGATHSSSTALVGTPPSGTGRMLIGGNDATSQEWQGRLSDVAVFSRGMSAKEARDWFDQSRLLHPRTLRRLSAFEYLVAEGTSPPPPPPPSPATPPAISVIGPAWAELVDVWAATTVRPMEVPGTTLPTVPPTPLPQATSGLKPFVPRDPEAPPRLRPFQDKVSQLLNSLMGRGQIVMFSDGAYSVGGGILANRAPGVDDDVADGAIPGMLWVWSGASRVWVCVSNAPGAAVWLELATA